jgi:hypothetical protein
MVAGFRKGMIRVGWQAGCLGGGAVMGRTEGGLARLQHITAAARAAAAGSPRRQKGGHRTAVLEHCRAAPRPDMRTSASCAAGGGRWLAGSGRGESPGARPLHAQPIRPRERAAPSPASEGQRRALDRWPLDEGRSRGPAFFVIYSRRAPAPCATRTRRAPLPVPYILLTGGRCMDRTCG